jgi:dCTP deaminase
MISPFVERDIVRGKSFGLSAASYDIRIAQSVTIHPGGFVLASTLERFCIPHDVLMVVHDKSSHARRGLSVFNTVFDPGWGEPPQFAYATLELTNHGRETLTILAGDPIAQVVCHLLTEPTTQPYAGKYQNQEPGPQPARDDGPGSPLTDREEIDAAKVEALVDVLRVGLPKLVETALHGRDKLLRSFVADLPNTEWEMLRREEDQRRQAMSEPQPQPSTGGVND